MRLCLPKVKFSDRFKQSKKSARRGDQESKCPLIPTENYSVEKNFKNVSKFYWNLIKKSVENLSQNLKLLNTVSNRKIHRKWGPKFKRPFISD